MINLRHSRHGNRNKNKIALTFDDGPNPHATYQILDILESANIRATFFVIGKRCTEYTDLVKEIAQRGHLVGNHSYSHARGDFEMCNDVILNILNTSTDYVRPPFYDLAFCEKEYKFLKDKFIVTGDVDSKDYLLITKDEVIKNVVTHVTNGSIIDLHDGSEIDDDLKERAQKTTEALPEIIKILKAQFDLVRIDEMDLGEGLW